MALRARFFVRVVILMKQDSIAIVLPIGFDGRVGVLGPHDDSAAFLVGSIALAAQRLAVGYRGGHGVDLPELSAHADARFSRNRDDIPVRRDSKGHRSAGGILVVRTDLADLA